MNILKPEIIVKKNKKGNYILKKGQIFYWFYHFQFLFFLY